MKFVDCLGLQIRSLQICCNQLESFLKGWIWRLLVMISAWWIWWVGLNMMNCCWIWWDIFSSGKALTRTSCKNILTFSGLPAFPVVARILPNMCHRPLSFFCADVCRGSEWDEGCVYQATKAPWIQGGPLLVINGVITLINGLIIGFAWGYFTPISGLISPYL